MFPAEAKAATATALLNSANAANTAQATGGWVDIRGFVGDLVVIQNVGAITGNIAGALKASTAANGANNVALPFDDGNNFALVSAANNIQIKTVDVNSCSGWVQYVGTVGTGPAVVGVTLIARPKVM